MALVLYKNRLAERLHDYLLGTYGQVDLLLTCCRHTPTAAAGRCVINVCPGCDRRYRQNYERPSTVSLVGTARREHRFRLPGLRRQADERTRRLPHQRSTASTMRCDAWRRE